MEDIVFVDVAIYLEKKLIQGSREIGNVWCIDIAVTNVQGEFMI